jgi:hypothetical protein
MRICFLVGSMAISGGTYVIVQHASYLKEAGHDVTLAVQEPFTAETLAWHDKAPQLRCIPFGEGMVETFDIVIATWWKTALELASFNASRYGYFVQSIESRFYPAEEVPLRALVDATYRLPVSYVTEATWIRHHLAAYGHEAALVLNGIRKDVYRPEGIAMASRPSRGAPRVLVEGHFGVRFKNTALAIRLAREAGSRDNWLLTGSPVRWVPGMNRVFSRVPMVETAAIYRSCDVLIKLSTVEGMFGPPLEMFHCGGTAVVFDVTGHDEYIRHNDNGLVAPSGDLHAVVSHVTELLGDRNHLLRLKEGALATAAAWPDWAQSSEAFCHWVEALASAPEMGREAVREVVSAAWERYHADEGARLARQSRLPGRRKLSAMAARMPRSMVLAVKRAEAVGEVIFGGRKAY